MEGEANFNCDINNLKATELRLGLPGTDMPEKATPSTPRGSKRGFTEECRSSSEVVGGAPPAKAQVVGWPPVRSYRRNLQARKAEAEAAGIYVKVSMDGAPYLRKIDLKVYMGYKDLREGLDDMFKGFSLGDLLEKGSEHALAYEDRDGDWMMVGDVPWEMFISCCKRLRIMRGNEAIGLASNS